MSALVNVKTASKGGIKTRRPFIKYYSFKNKRSWKE